MLIVYDGGRAAWWWLCGWPGSAAHSLTETRISVYNDVVCRLSVERRRRLRVYDLIQRRRGDVVVPSSGPRVVTLGS